MSSLSKFKEFVSAYEKSLQDLKEFVEEDLTDLSKCDKENRMMHYSVFLAGNLTAALGMNEDLVFEIIKSLEKELEDE